MIIDNETMESAFDIVHSNIYRPSLALTDLINSLRPSDPSSMDWRFELRGLLLGLNATGAFQQSALYEVQKILFGSVKTEFKRKGRDCLYSVDIVATSADCSPRLVQFDVAAMNPIDAYLQLTKRLVYRTIPDVRYVEVYYELLKNRTASQIPLRTFERDQLVREAP